MNIFKPFKKLFRKKNLRKIGIGLGVAAGLFVLGSGVAGMASGGTFTSGVSAASGKLAGALGFGGAGAGDTVAGGTAAGSTAGLGTIGGTALGGGVTATGPTVAPAATGTTTGFGLTPISSSASTGIAASGLSRAAAPTVTTLGESAAVPFAGQGISHTGGLLRQPTMQAVSSQSVVPPFQLDRVLGQGAGAGGINPGGTPGANVFANRIPGASATRGLMAAGASTGVTPRTIGTTQPIARPGGGGGLLQTGNRMLNQPAAAAQQSGGFTDWLSNVPPIMQFALLRGAEGAFAEDPREVAARIEEQQRRNRRVPSYRGGRFVVN